MPLPVLNHPRDLGARCDECLIHRLAPDAAPPVLSEYNPGARFTAVGEAPGIREREADKPFAGASGRQELATARRVGLANRRDEIHWLNALSCRPADAIGGDDSGSFGRLDTAWKAENRARKSRGELPLPHPVDCCRPRLLRELDSLKGAGDRIITLGDGAAQALIPGHRGGVLNIRGGPITLRQIDPDAPGLSGWLMDDPEGLPAASPLWKARARKILPTVHPAFVLQARKYEDAALVDHARAGRHFAGKLQWRDPAMRINPTVAAVAAFLGVTQDPTARRGERGCGDGWRALSKGETPNAGRTLAYDFETDGIDTQTCKVRCIGIGDDKEGILVAFLSRDGHTTFYPPQEIRALWEILIAWATGPAWKLSWNGGYYDSLVFEAQTRTAQHPRGFAPDPGIDGILLHHLAQPDLPHGLAYVASIYTDIHAWKAGKEAVDAADGVKDDDTLWRYCLRDVAATFACVNKLWPRVRAEKMGRIEHRVTPRFPFGQLKGAVRVDAEMQRICRSMSRMGLLVDQEERQRLTTLYDGIARQQAARARAIVDDPSLNLNSTAQVGSLLYSKRGFGLEPPEYTESGAPSTNDSACRALLRDPTVPQQAREYLLAHRRAKKADKISGTFLRPVSPLLRGDPRAAEAETARTEAARALREVRSLLPVANAATWGAALAPGVKGKIDTAEKSALRYALFDVWGLTPIRTPKGGITLARDGLLKMWQARQGPPEARRFLGAWFRYLLHNDEAIRLGKPPEEAEEERCILGPDGRFFADWKAHVVITGRLASSPNCQNIPRAARSMYVPGPGHAFVYADADQLELRGAASRWGLARYLEAFNTTKTVMVNGKPKVFRMDPHQITMHAIFGDSMWAMAGAPPPEWQFYKKWPGGEISGEFDKQRDLGKRVCYAGLYWAEAPTVHDVITSAEDDAGNLIYQDKSLGEVAAMLEAWREGVPELEAGWHSELQLAEAQGYIEEPVSGRRFYFLDGLEPNKVVNAPIQGLGAGLIAQATIEFEREYPEGFGGRYTGLSAVVHDALIAEVPEDRAVEVQRRMQTLMTREHPALPGLRFEAEAKIKMRLEDQRF